MRADPGPGPGPGLLLQSSLDGFYKRAEYDMDTLLVHAFAVHSLPLHILQSEVFINMMHCWRESRGLLPTRKRMRTMYHDAASSMRQEVLNNIKASRAIPVTVALDGWTNTCHEKVINIIPVSSGTAYYWKSIVLSTSRCTAMEQYPEVRDAIQSLISNSIVVAAITTDNEAVNGALYRLLLADFPDEPASDGRVAINPTTAFIMQYIEDNHITPLWKWNADKTNQLEVTAIKAGITDTSGELKKKIMARVNEGVAAE